MARSGTRKRRVGVVGSRQWFLCEVCDDCNMPIDAGHTLRDGSKVFGKICGCNVWDDMASYQEIAAEQNIEWLGL